MIIHPMETIFPLLVIINVIQELSKFRGKKKKGKIKKKLKPLLSTSTDPPLINSFMHAFAITARRKRSWG